jgi:hypothetical protein
MTEIKSPKGSSRDPAKLLQKQADAVYRRAATLATAEAVTAIKSDAGAVRPGAWYS